MPVIIGVSIVGFIVLATVTIGLVVYYKRSRSSVNKTRVRDGMPPDESFARREEYELHPAGEEKDNIKYGIEERGFGNEGIRMD